MIVLYKSLMAKKNLLLFSLTVLSVLQSLAQAPIITSFSPSSGAVGTTVTITGSNFSTTAGNNIVYFGAVNVRNTRYAVGAMLLADLVGIITSIFMAYLFFGE